MPRCTQDQQYCQSIDQLAELLRVISEPNRLKIICLLARQEYCVCEIFGELDLAQNLVSHHLAVLREADLVSTRKAGKSVYYQLNQERIRLIQETLTGVMGVGCS